MQKICIKKNTIVKVNFFTCLVRDEKSKIVFESGFFNLLFLQMRPLIFFIVRDLVFSFIIKYDVLKQNCRYAYRTSNLIPDLE